MLALVAGVLLAATILQSMIGFGMGLLAIPALVWGGMPLPHAVAIVVGGGLAQLCIGLWRVRRDIDVGTAVHVGIASWLAIPLGVAVMVELTQIEPDDMRRGVGIAVVALVTIRLAFRPKLRSHVARGWAWLAGFGSGFLGGLVGMGGPPLVLFAMTNDWSVDRFRAFLWLQFLAAYPLMLGVLTWRFGPEVLERFVLGVACAPIAWAGTRIGIAATKRWDPARLRLVATIMLYLVGLSGIV